MQSVVLLFLCAIVLIDAQPKTSTFTTNAVSGGNLLFRNNDCLWPPNHKYVYFNDVAKSDKYVKFTGCAFPVEKKVLGCVSDQEDNGLGDGNTVRDCVYVPKYDSVCVRSERQGMKPEGRTYHVIFELTSKCFTGPLSAKWPIHVPHDAADDWDTKTCWDPNHQTSRAISCDPDLLPPTTTPLCQPGKCDDGNDCTDDSCNEATGQCTHTSISCDDNDPCTVDTCARTGGVSSASVTQLTGNPNCATLGYSSEAKYEPPKAGNGQTLDITDSVVVSIDVSSDVQKASFEITGGSVVAVIVKAGTDSLVYKYPSLADADQAIHGPARPQGGFYQISHITFCWSTAEPVVAQCRHEPLSCTSTDRCQTATCVSSKGGCVFTPVPAPREAGFCETLNCNPATGWVYGDANIQCSDNNLCTVDTCDNALGCVFTPRTDGPKTNACQTSSCDPNSGVWSVTEKPCSTADACSVSTCNPATGACEVSPKSCTTDLFCKLSSCVPGTGCILANKAPPPATDDCYVNVCDETTRSFIPVSTGKCSAPVNCPYNVPVGLAACSADRLTILESRRSAFENVLIAAIGSKYLAGSLTYGVSASGDDMASIYVWVNTADLTADEASALNAAGKTFFVTLTPKYVIYNVTEHKGSLELFPNLFSQKRALVEESAFPVVGAAFGAVALVAFVVVAVFFVKRN